MDLYILVAFAVLLAAQGKILNYLLRKMGSKIKCYIETSNMSSFKETNLAGKVSSTLSPV